MLYSLDAKSNNLNDQLCHIKTKFESKNVIMCCLARPLVCMVDCSEIIEFTNCSNIAKN